MQPVEIIRVISVRLGWFVAGVVVCLMVLSYSARGTVSRYAQSDGRFEGTMLKAEAIKRAYLGREPLQLRAAKDGQEILLGETWFPMTRAETTLAQWTKSVTVVSRPWPAKP